VSVLLEPIDPFAHRRSSKEVDIIKVIAKSEVLQSSAEEMIERLEPFGWIVVSLRRDETPDALGRKQTVTRGRARRGNWVATFYLAPQCEDGDIIDKRVLHGAETTVELRAGTAKLWVSAKDGDSALRELASVVSLLGPGFEGSGTETQKQGFSRCVERLRARRWRIDRAMSSWWDFDWVVTGRRRGERLYFEGGLGPGDNVRDSFGWPSVPSVDDDGQARCAGDSWTSTLAVDSMRAAIALVEAIAGRACAELAERESFLV
jgi:hypothetical protein